jgi:hypothetical protein
MISVGYGGGVLCPTQTKNPTAGLAVGVRKLATNQNPTAALVSSAFVSSRFRLRFMA